MKGLILIIRKLTYVLSLLISVVYGFTVLLIFDMVNHMVNFTPAFKMPSQKGILFGVASFIGYLILMKIISRVAQIKEKQEIVKYILINASILISALILFWWIGVIFFVETPNYG